MCCISRVDPRGERRVFVPLFCFYRVFPPQMEIFLHNTVRHCLPRRRESTIESQSAYTGWHGVKKRWKTWVELTFSMGSYILFSFHVTIKNNIACPNEWWYFGCANAVNSTTEPCLFNHHITSQKVLIHFIEHLNDFQLSKTAFKSHFKEITK